MPDQQAVEASVEVRVEVPVESVVVVDDHNFVLGSVPREIMREEALCHRATYIFVFNSKGQLYVQERTLNKDIYPGFYDPATGGVVVEGESYDQAAERELAEELGIANVPITPHFHFFFHNADCQVWGRVYSCYYDGPVTLQKEEVASVVLESPAEVLDNRNHRNYTPDSLVALERLVHCLETF
ncbi:NUDIX hydrolase YfcD [Endozoicomonas sp. SCSIO W0465]|uniref:NUDIX hydrolase YfcD n=1 Tax=Endozoicomonas sp. SCSIO W0465 TaxID=2918516 RepID=UPI0020752B13|nr:NUDIX hydrolase YfcD [Endozoicomonas sp. SCSIO W0465]USE39436.1 NUDIX hydrolase YfcD [Endozoicomonas sp. SCSIO W0465]